MMITMNQITKEIFISTIDSLQAQVSRDINASNAISQVFDTDAVYDNSLLVKAVIKLLQIHFPKDDKGFCEIEHYCFDMNFGKIQGEELVTAEDLWDRLTEIKISWKNIERYDADKLSPKKYIHDEVGQWPTDVIKTFKPLFGKDKLFLKESMTSTHPLIDDNPKIETLLEFVENKLKEVRILRDTSDEYKDGAKRHSLHGEFNAYCEVLKKLKEDGV